MRVNRHRAELCSKCQAPLPSRAGRCWRCGSERERNDEPTTPLALTTNAPSAPEKKAA